MKYIFIISLLIFWFTSWGSYIIYEAGDKIINRSCLIFFYIAMISIISAIIALCHDFNIKKEN